MNLFLPGFSDLQFAQQHKMFLMHAPVISLKGSKDLFLYPLLKFNESPRHYGVMPFLDGGQKSSLLFQRRPRLVRPLRPASAVVCAKKKYKLKKIQDKERRQRRQSAMRLGKIRWQSDNFREMTGNFQKEREGTKYAFGYTFVFN